jgi:hypothetical protein
LLELKRLVSDNKCDVRLMMKGKVLRDDEATLSHLKVRDGVTIHAVFYGETDDDAREITNHEENESWMEWLDSHPTSQTLDVLSELNSLMDGSMLSFEPETTHKNSHQVKHLFARVKHLETTLSRLLQVTTTTSNTLSSVSPSHSTRKIADVLGTVGNAFKAISESLVIHNEYYWDQIVYEPPDHGPPELIFGGDGGGEQGINSATNTTTTTTTTTSPVLSSSLFSSSSSSQHNMNNNNPSSTTTTASAHVGENDDPYADMPGLTPHTHNTVPVTRSALLNNEEIKTEIDNDEYSDMPGLMETTNTTTANTNQRSALSSSTTSTSNSTTTTTQNNPGRIGNNNLSFRPGFLLGRNSNTSTRSNANSVTATTTTSSSTSTQSTSSATPAQDLNAMSIKELKAFILSHGGNPVAQGIVEKSQLVELAKSLADVKPMPTTIATTTTTTTNTTQYPSDTSKNNNDARDFFQSVRGTNSPLLHTPPPSSPSKPLFPSVSNNDIIPPAFSTTAATSSGHSTPITSSPMKNSSQHSTPVRNSLKRSAPKPSTPIRSYDSTNDRISTSSSSHVSPSKEVASNLFGSSTIHEMMKQDGSNNGSTNISPFAAAYAAAAAASSSIAQENISSLFGSLASSITSSSSVGNNTSPMFVFGDSSGNSINNNQTNSTETKLNEDELSTLPTVVVVATTNSTSPPPTTTTINGTNSRSASQSSDNNEQQLQHHIDYFDLD